MNLLNKRILVFTVCAVTTFLFVHLCPVRAEGGTLDVSKPIGRTYDPVKLPLNHDLIQSLFPGGQRPLVSELGLYRWERDRFVSIPFQVNQYEQGKIILDRRNINVEEHGGSYRKKSNLIEFSPAAQRRHLAAGDELVFLVEDIGRRLPHNNLFKQFTSGVELCITDPVNGEKGWTYLMKPGNAHRKFHKEKQPGDNLHHSLEEVRNTKGKVTKHLERIRARNFSIMFDITKSGSYKEFRVTEKGQGNNENLVIEFRSTAFARLKGIPWTFRLNPGRNLLVHMIGSAEGPVELQRVVYNKVVLPLLGEQEDMSLLTTSHYYPGYLYFIGRLKLPLWLKKFVKTLDSEMTTDFNRNAMGMTWYNSNNTEGILVDGRMSEAERRLNSDAYQWSLLVGDQGGWANIMNMKTEGMKAHMRLYFEDNASRKPHAIFGSTGYKITQVLEVPELVFSTYTFSVPRTFTPQDMQQLVDLVYHPIRVEVARRFKPLEGR